MRQRRHGFTLLEIGIVLLVLSLLMGGVLGAVAQRARIAKSMEAQNKISAIQDALAGFRKKENRLPCPADATKAVTASSFGMAADVPGTCTGGDIEANLDDSSNTVGGVVPVKTLGLPDEYMFDPWGGRFTYIIDKRATATSAFTTYDISNTTIGSITVKDSAGNDRTAKAVLAIISHGPNGHGAYQFEGSQRKSADSANAAEQKNCHCDDDAAAAAFDATVYMQNEATSLGNVLDSYDDITLYFLRSDFVAAADLVQE